MHLQWKSRMQTKQKCEACTFVNEFFSKNCYLSCKFTMKFWWRVYWRRGGTTQHSHEKSFFCMDTMIKFSIHFTNWRKSQNMFLEKYTRLSKKRPNLDFLVNYHFKPSIAERCVPLTQLSWIQRINARVLASKGQPFNRTCLCVASSPWL